ncbi:MAG: hypothetical protein C3F13_18520 [Anaerolineales bacterium]|nr:MAG: hypothetical protein C3F13_18520 [Anaerolineales bacterium]
MGEVETATMTAFQFSASGMRASLSIQCSAQLNQAAKCAPAGSSHQVRRSAPAARRVGSRHRRLRCDCGLPAVVVKTVKVGSSPQYTIRLPLCPACLKLEQELQR